MADILYTIAVLSAHASSVVLRLACFQAKNADGPRKRSWSRQVCCRNEPNVHKVEMRDNVDRWHGAQLSLIIAGHWQYYRAKVLLHCRALAVIDSRIAHHELTQSCKRSERLVH